MCTDTKVLCVAMVILDINNDWGEFIILIWRFMHGMSTSIDTIFCHFLNYFIFLIVKEIKDGCPCNVEGRALATSRLSPTALRWVGLWGFLWWAPSTKRKDHHGVSSRWSSTWFHSDTGLSSTQYEQIPIIFGVWPFWLTPFFFRSITFWWVYS